VAFCRQKKLAQQKIPTQYAKQSFKQVRQQDAYLPYGGGQLQLCATPHLLFKCNISIADCMPLAYSKRLKLMAVSNAGVYEKLAIRDQCCAG